MTGQAPSRTAAGLLAPAQVGDTKAVVRDIEAKLESVYGYDGHHIEVTTKKKGLEIGIERFRPSVVIYTEAIHHPKNILAAIDCRSKNAEAARPLLEHALRTSSANVCGWTDGFDHLFLSIGGDGELLELPDLPRANQSLEEIGKYRRNQLVKPVTLIREFNDIRNHLAANADKVTRDSVLATEITKLLLCKVYDELHTPAEDLVTFRAEAGESPEKTARRVRGLFADVKREYEDLFRHEDHLELDGKSIAYTVGVLQNYALTLADRDVIGEAFETFIGPSLRGNEGQFFTPRNVVRLAVEVTNPKPGERILDPACGSGGFLGVALEHVWTRIEEQGESEGWSAEEIHAEKLEAGQNIYGIDKDDFLARLAGIYLAILGDSRGGVYCENSLAPPSTWSEVTHEAIGPGSFDVVVTNPPFGSKIPVKGEELLSQYELGHAWKSRGKKGQRTYERKDVLKKSEAPQVLFVERCLQLLKPGGRLAIVLPEGILGNTSDGPVREVLRQNAEIIAVIDCPKETFLPSTPTKTSVVVAQKRADPEQGPVFMAIADQVGHDRRGNPVFNEDGSIADDFPRIADAFEGFREKHELPF